jgi:hypothetical protein
MSSLDIGEGVGHDGGMGKLWALSFAALIAFLCWAHGYGFGLVEGRHQERLDTCKQSTCKGGAVPELIRNRCLCVEMAQ